MTKKHHDVQGKVQIFQGTTKCSVMSESGGTSINGETKIAQYGRVHAIVVWDGLSNWKNTTLRIVQGRMHPELYAFGVALHIQSEVMRTWGQGPTSK